MLNQSKHSNAKLEFETFLAKMCDLFVSADVRFACNMHFCNQPKYLIEFHRFNCIQRHQTVFQSVINTVNVLSHTATLSASAEIQTITKKLFIASFRQNPNLELSNIELAYFI